MKVPGGEMGEKFYAAIHTFLPDSAWLILLTFGRRLYMATKLVILACSHCPGAMVTRVECFLG
ncbi:hypothetical protein CH063_00931 [Colletotrichum higginsianum]|uniref:Uncharacterized protein n=1 Tax=Colletotrichum higginsianum (strain IMI 349063) TaxID=759273 RepID=H1UYY7_COLHI|nr:hypothetical protein CH063_00931 [Colletotrichum higginsianum]